MAYSVPDLSYPFDALEPHIDAKTMEIHHDKHHAAYVTNLNAALEGTEWMDHPIESVLANLDAIPEEKRMAVRNNGGGHANHSLFWEIMSPDGGGEPVGALADAISETFGGVDELHVARSGANIACRWRGEPLSCHQRPQSLRASVPPWLTRNPLRRATRPFG